MAADVKEVLRSVGNLLNHEQAPMDSMPCPEVSKKCEKNSCSNASVRFGGHGERRLSRGITRSAQLLILPRLDAVEE